jgi:hypothetical protein
VMGNQAGTLPLVQPAPVLHAEGALALVPPKPRNVGNTLLIPTLLMIVRFNTIALCVILWLIRL